MIRPAFRPIPPGWAALFALVATWAPVLLVLLLAGCVTVDLSPRWDARERIWYYASEAESSAECYRRGARMTGVKNRMPVACYVWPEDVIIMSDYRIGVPTAPGLKAHELGHRRDFKTGKGSWHR